MAEQINNVTNGDELVVRDVLERARQRSHAPTVIDLGLVLQAGHARRRRRRGTRWGIGALILLASVGGSTLAWQSSSSQVAIQPPVTSTPTPTDGRSSSDLPAESPATLVEFVVSTRVKEIEQGLVDAKTPFTSEFGWGSETTQKIGLTVVTGAATTLELPAGCARAAEPGEAACVVADTPSGATAVVYTVDHLRDVLTDDLWTPHRELPGSDSPLWVAEVRYPSGQVVGVFSRGTDPAFLLAMASDPRLIAPELKP